MKRRKKWIKIIGILLLSTLLSTSCNLEKEGHFSYLTKKQCMEDFEYLQYALETTYPYLNVARRSGISVDDLFEKAKERVVNSQDEVEFYEAIAQLVNGINRKGPVGHLVLFDDSLRKDFGDLYRGSADESTFDKYLAYILQNKKTEKRYQQLEEVRMEKEAQVGLERKVPKVAHTFARKEVEKNLLLIAPPYFSDQSIEEGNIAYIRIPSFEHKRVEQEHDKLIEIYKKYANYENVIFDIRGNGGGDSTYWVENIALPNTTKTYKWKYVELFSVQKGNNDKYIEMMFPKESIKPIKEFVPAEKFATEDLEVLDYFIEEQQQLGGTEEILKGKKWVLIDDGVYSSAESFAIFCKETGFATLVGTNSEGDGMGSDPFLLTLPNSRFVVRYSCTYGINSNGTNNEEYGTTPDIVTEEDALNFCVDYIKEQEKK